MFADLQYRALCRFWPSEQHTPKPAGDAKLDLYIHPFFEGLDGLTILDFGCGTGRESMALATKARQVVGLDINEPNLARAREGADRLRIPNVSFVRGLPPDAKFDAVVSIDAFEHFGDPAEILHQMHAALRPGGRVLASFGPTWYHPYGGHLFSAFPWAHLLLSEQALLKWRNRFRENKATSMMEGLNGWSIRRFERLVRNSEFVVEVFRCIPISTARFLHCGLTREFTTAVVQMKLRKR